MINTTQEYQLPSPVSGQQFQLTTIAGSIVSQRTQGQNVFMTVLAQGNPANVARTFQWQAIGTPWDDVAPTQYLNIFAVLAFPNASWVLLQVTPH